MKILQVVGARPQFIKLAPVSLAIRERGHSEFILHTGQHFDDAMSRVFFEELEIALPDKDLGVNSLSHGAMTGRMIEGIEQVLVIERPDAVLVYGDTDSTLAGTIAATKLQMTCGHIEAGLRSFNRVMPEELNRIATDHLADVLFAPTNTAMKNLECEGLKGRSRLVGDVMLDAFNLFGSRAAQTGIAEKLGLSNNGFLLATLHRAGTTDDVRILSEVCEALDRISRTFLPVVLPLHPRTRKNLHFSNISLPHVKIIEPVSYLQMIRLLQTCRAVLTDSGGLQKEAYFSGKVCFTLRNETEWIETIECGANVLCGTDKQNIVANVSRLLDHEASAQFGDAPYGYGKTSDGIVEVLASFEPK